MIEIDLEELRKALDVVIRHVESTTGSPVVKIPVDFFWSVPTPDIYAVDRTPALTIGQLSESWGNLRRERVGDESQTIAFAAVWLGDVLKAFGHKAIG